MRSAYATQFLYSCRYPSAVRSPLTTTTSGRISLSSAITRFIRLGTKNCEPTCGSEMCAIVTTGDSSLVPRNGGGTQVTDQRL